MSSVQGFRKQSFTLSDEMGQEIVNYCVSHGIEPSKANAKIISDYWISRGITTGQPHPPIEALEHLDQVFFEQYDKSVIDKHEQQKTPEKIDYVAVFEAWELEHPHTVLLIASSSKAKLLREHCLRKGKNMSKILSSLIDNYLTDQEK